MDSNGFTWFLLCGSEFLECRTAYSSLFAASQLIRPGTFYRDLGAAIEASAAQRWSKFKGSEFAFEFRERMRKHQTTYNRIRRKLDSLGTFGSCGVVIVPRNRQAMPSMQRHQVCCPSHWKFMEDASEPRPKSAEWSEWLRDWVSTNLLYHGQAGKNNCAVVTTCPWRCRSSWTGTVSRVSACPLCAVHRCPGTAGMGWDSCSTAHLRCPTTGMASHGIPWHPMASHGILRKLPCFFRQFEPFISISYHHIHHIHHITIVTISWLYDDLWWFMMIYDDLWWFMSIHHI